MNIRRYTLISIVTIILISVVSILSYQLYFSHKAEVDMEELSNYDRFVKTEESDIKIYKDGKWETFKVKGVELSSFQPGYARFKSSIEKKDLIDWLEQIGEMNANLIKIPYIQPSSFYDAIYDYNSNREEPLYIIHEVMLDERALLKDYDAFDGRIIKKLKRDIKNTIDLVNGRGLILGNKRGHRGVYLKDISSYNLGFIIGTNVNSELITLTDASNKDKEDYLGKYFSSKDGSPFESFIAEVLDFTASYEIDKYKRLSLLSFLTRVETDPFEYKHESNLTKHARINIENIQDESRDNLFVSYKFHPNETDFLSYEYENEKREINDKLYFTRHLERLNSFYKLPVLISDTGISTSRGISKVDERDGFNRGGFTEKEQGEKIVKLLDEIYKTGLAGGVINSWQDNWTNLTSFNLIQDYTDSSASSYWHDLQSSDESFGLMKFEAGKEERGVYLDGERSDWEDTKTLLEEDGIKLKVKSDSANLYIYLEKDGWSLKDDSLYIGLNISPFSGSKRWEDKAEFSTEADFIVKLQGYNESRIVVNERYNIFNYTYKYYKNIIDKEDKPPLENSNKFNAIYLLNRNKFELKNKEENLPPIYYETGRLLHGTDNPESDEFNSLVDFNKTGNMAEIKIPWVLINIRNPLDKKAYGDFYWEGITSQIDVDHIGFSVNWKNNKEEIVSEEVIYRLEKLKNLEYFERKKDSYDIIKNYWKEDL